MLRTIEIIEIEDFEKVSGSKKKQHRKTRKYEARLKNLFLISLGIQKKYFQCIKFGHIFKTRSTHKLKSSEIQTMLMRKFK